MIAADGVQEIGGWQWHNGLGLCSEKVVIVTPLTLTYSIVVEWAVENGWVLHKKKKVSEVDIATE